jgi:hypothetical protein
VTPDPNDALLEQLTQAGLYPQQLAQLQRQYQLAQGFMQPQEAQGRQVGGTYVAASPWEHLANAIRPMVGAYMQRSAQNREQDLTSQLSSGRQAFARALQDTQGKPGEFMPGGAGDQQGMQRLSMMGAASGDPVIQHAAQTAQAYPQALLKMSLEQQQLDKIRQQNDAMQSPAGRAALLKTIETFSPGFTQSPDVANAPSPTLEHIMGPLEKLAQAKQMAALANNRFQFTQGLREDQFKSKRAEDFNKALDAMMPKGGLKNYTDTINRAQKLSALYTDPQTGQLKATLTPQDMVEGAIALQQLVANGHASQSEVEQMLPKGSGTDRAKLLQYFTNKPWDAGQQEWAVRQLHTAAQEAGVSQKTILDTIRKRVPTYQDFRQAAPDQWSAMMEAHDLDPSAFDQRGLVPEGKQFWKDTAPPVAIPGERGGRSSGVRKFTRGPDGKLVEVK